MIHYHVIVVLIDIFFCSFVNKNTIFNNRSNYTNEKKPQLHIYLQLCTRLLESSEYTENFYFLEL